MEPRNRLHQNQPRLQHCYAETMARRLKGMGQAKYANGFEVTLHPETLRLPPTWKRPKRVFVNSMSDLFHKDVSVSFIQDVFGIMREASQHQFQVLTKRSERMLELSQDLPWPKNIWLGVTVESEEYLYRVDHLRQTPAAIKFISFEPLLGPINGFEPDGIHWVIVGGETGPGARSMERKWPNQIRKASVAAKVPFFFKKWGGFRDQRGNLLNGRVWHQLPG